MVLEPLGSLLFDRDPLRPSGGIELERHGDRVNPFLPIVIIMDGVPYNAHRKLRPNSSQTFFGHLKYYRKLGRGLWTFVYGNTF